MPKHTTTTCSTSPSLRSNSGALGDNPLQPAKETAALQVHCIIAFRIALEAARNPPRHPILIPFEQ